MATRSKSLASIRQLYRVCGPNYSQVGVGQKPASGYGGFVSTLRRYSSTSEENDVVAVGDRSGGHVAGIRASWLGLRTSCIGSRGTLGGTCLNAGCILSKSTLQIHTRSLDTSALASDNSRTQGKLNILTLKVSSFENEDKGTAALSGDIFDVPIRKDIIHRVVRWQLAKRRQGRHSTKTISEVSGTGKKPHQQKGTGRARHGTLRGPQFRHGATMHGPKPRSHAIGLQKKVRRLGLKIALSARAAENKLLLFDSIQPPSHKTREMVKFISGLENCKKILFVDGSDKVNEPLRLATQNLHYANVLPAKGLNVYSVLLHDTLAMTVDAVRYVEDHLHTPISR